MSTLALCIPAYNAVKHLPALLNSANNQSIPFDEIIIYNDTSNDATALVAKAMGATVIEGDVNVGCSLGKNRIANLAKSDWLHFHDSDDLLLPNFTTVAHKWINEGKSPDIILLHFHYIDFETRKLLGEPDYNIKDIREDATRFNINNKVVNFALIKKAPFLQIGGFDTDMNVLYNEDRAFYTKAAIAGLKFDYEPELTCVNYLYPNSMSANNIAKCARAAFHVWLKVIENTGSKYSVEISAQLLQNATYAATGNDWRTVKESVLKAKSIYPAQVPVGTGYFKLLYNFFSYRSYFIREILIKYFTSKRIK